VPRSKPMTSKLHWLTWLALPAVTLAMIAAGQDSSKGLLLGLLLVAMSVKAGLVGGTFMRERSEDGALLLVVSLGLLLVAAGVVTGIVPAALRVLQMGPAI
jgi:hypothetical protein